MHMLAWMSFDYKIVPVLVLIDLGAWSPLSCIWPNFFSVICLNERDEIKMWLFRWIIYESINYLDQNFESPDSTKNKILNQPENKDEDISTI